MITRRGFLGALAAAATGLVLDPERLLWLPGQKTIFLPPIETFQPTGNVFVTPDWITKETLRLFKNQLQVMSLVNRAYDRSSGGAIVGDTISVRLPTGFARVGNPAAH